ncbi:MAG: STM3941 family protein, partial [Algoriella sp.]
VFHPSQKLNYIVWGNIAEIEELKLPRQRIINIKVIDSEKYINAENQKFLQTRMKFWNQMYGAVVSFDANTLDKNHFEIMYIFDEFMDDYKTSLQTKTN